MIYLYAAQNTVLNTTASTVFDLVFLFSTALLIAIIMRGNNEKDN